MDEQGKMPEFRFVKPSTLVKSADLIKTWEKSDSYFEYLGFILAIGESIKGRKIRNLRVRKTLKRSNIFSTERKTKTFISFLLFQPNLRKN